MGGRERDKETRKVRDKGEMSGGWGESKREAIERQFLCVFVC